MSTFTIYGDAWLSGDKLVQEVTTFTDDHCSKEEVVTIVENIWTDLLSNSGQYKSNDKKNYFYWEYNLTTLEDEQIKGRFTCPVPKHDLFTNFEVLESDGDYVKYWKPRIKKCRENAENALAVQRKTIYLQGSDYIDQNGNTRTIEDMYIDNSNNLGDISNLLSLY